MSICTKSLALVSFVGLSREDIGDQDKICDLQEKINSAIRVHKAPEIETNDIFYNFDEDGSLIGINVDILVEIELFTKSASSPFSALELSEVMEDHLKSFLALEDRKVKILTKRFPPDKYFCYQAS